jgi:ketosteroid isomerase-like protein
MMRANIHGMKLELSSVGGPCTRRNVTSLALIAFACIALGASQTGWCQQQSEHNHRHLYQKQVEALEQQWRQAQLHGDAAAIDRLLADDYIGITANGTLQNKEQTLTRMRARTTIIKQLDLSEVKVSVHGETASVTCRADVQSTQNGVERGGTFRYTRVYQHRAGVWKIVNFEGTRINPGANATGANSGAAESEPTSPTGSTPAAGQSSVPAQPQSH